MADDQRLELRVSQEWLAGLDGARGSVPRGTFVKRVVEKALGGSEASAEVRRSPAPSRPSVEKGVPDRVVAPSIEAPVRREGESVVAFNIRRREWQQRQS